MTLIKYIKYSKNIDFIWIRGHYDIHINGLCYYNGRICEFKTDYVTEICSIYSLSLFNVVRWKVRQKLFEWCIGYHWTYPLEASKRYGSRRPRWLWELVFNLYYWRKFGWINHREISKN